MPPHNPPRNSGDIIAALEERVRLLERRLLHTTHAHSHGALSGVTADQHHTKSHGASDHTTAISVEDEGVAKGDVKRLDFTGAGVAVTVAGDQATVAVSGGGGGVTDHGALTGLGDDDHPQYVEVAGDTMTGALAGTSASYSGNVVANQLVSTVTGAVQPVVVATSTLVSGLNADLVDGQHAAAFATSSDLSNHISDPTDAHDASAVSVVDTSFSQLSGTNAQSTFDAADNLIADLRTDVDTSNAHISNPTGAHAASAISYAGGTGMSAVNVETAIDELADEKTNKLGTYGLLNTIVILTASSGTYTPGTTGAANVLAVRFRGKAGGGAGGGGTNVVGSASCGSGGGEGAEGEFFDSGTLASSYDWVVGAGGTGVSGSAGNNGTATTVQDNDAVAMVLDLDQGDGGIIMGAGVAVTSNRGGLGGVGTTGDIVWNGAHGQIPLRTSGTAGISGNGAGQGGGLGRATHGNGNAATSTGGGGAGGNTLNGAGATLGGDGFAGYLIIEEYGYG